MDEVSFFGLLMQNIEEMDSDHIIMGGDFNLELDVTIDKQGGSPSTHSEAANFLNTYIKQVELIDVWSEINSDKTCFTWKCL